MSDIRSHQDLRVWQKSIDLVLDVYKLTAKFPSHERFGLSSQMQRAAVSIPANTAEGHARGTRNDFAHFLDMANGSVAELDTLLAIACKLSYCEAKERSTINEQLAEIGKMLGGLRMKLRSNSGN